MKGKLNSKNKIFKYASFMGIENRKNPLFTNENRASYMKNLLYSDGVLRKRNGLKEIYHFINEYDVGMPINGIYSYKGSVIIHSGNVLFKNGSKVSDCFLPDTFSYGFDLGECLYIICYGKLYVFDGNTLTDIYESQHQYVPITTKDISPVSMEETDTPYESENLLSSRRKNTLIGVKSNRTRYILDGEVDIEKQFSVLTKMRVKYESTEENVSTYNAIYENAKRLNLDNIEKSLGISNEEAEKLFGDGNLNVNLSNVSEVDVFLKMPIKVTSAIFTARGSTGVPRMTLLYQGDTVLDTEKISDVSVLDLTAKLNDTVIDEIRLYGNYSKGIIDKIEIYGKELYEGYVEIRHEVDSLEYKKGFNAVSITDISGEKLTLSQNLNGTSIIGCNLYLEKGINGKDVIYFNYEAVSDTLNQSNITVEYSVKNHQRIQCNFGEICKTDNGKAVLAVSDGKKVYISSSKGGVTYMPKNLEMEFDTVSSLCSKEGTTLFVFGSNKASVVELSIKDGETVCTLLNHSLQGGAISPLSSKTVNYDTLSLSSEGVFGSYGNETMRVRRGENIKHLLPENLENCIAIEHNGCLYLFIGSGVFVADTRLKVYENNRLDSSFQYEWWYLDGINARCVGKIEGEIYIGRNDGRVFKFHDGYFDIYCEKIKNGDYLFGDTEEGKTKIYLNQELNATSYDCVKVSNCYTLLCGVDGEVTSKNTVVLQPNMNRIFSLDGTLRIYPNLVLYLKNQEGNLIKAKCIEVDTVFQTITVETEEESECYTDILVKNENEKYMLQSENDYYVFLDRFGEEVRLYGIENAQVVLEKEIPIEVEYVSAPLLREGQSSFLYEIDVDLTKESGGIVTIEYETDKINVKGEMEYGQDLNFDNFDFGGFIFNSSLKKSHSFFTFERDFEYVILKIKSVSKNDFGIVSYGFVCR